MTTKNLIKTGMAGLMLVSITGEVAAQVSTKGLSPASNTARSYVDASIARDSGINQPLDLLNDFYPMVEVTVTDHDNVRRRPGFQENDLKIIVRPSLGYRTNIGRHNFYAAYSGTFTYHNDFGQEDTSSNAVIGQLGLDLARRWDLNIFGGVGSGFEERGVSGTRDFGQFIIGRDSGPDKVEFANFGADLIYGRKVSPLVAVLGFEKHDTQYKNNFQGRGNDFGDRGRVSTSVHFDLSYKIGAKTSIFGRIQDTEVDYDRTINSLDSDQTDFLIGLRWKPSNALSGVLAIGNSDRTYKQAGRENFDGTTYFANLNYMISPFSSLEFSASRTVEEPGDDRSDYYISEFFGIGWNHSLNSKLVFNAYAKWVEDDFNTDRKGDFFDYGLGLDYVWKPWLTAGIFYGEIERDSSLNRIDYDDKYIGIRLRSDLRPLLEGRGSRVEPESFDYPGPPKR